MNISASDCQKWDTISIGSAFIFPFNIYQNDVFLKTGEYEYTCIRSNDIESLGVTSKLLDFDADHTVVYPIIMELR